METLIILLHLLVAIAIIAFVLLQQGKGAEAGASFGAGASQTLFGSAGSWNFFSRVTAGLALLFFLTSLGLAILAKNKADGDDGLPPELRLLDAPAKEIEEIPQVESGVSEIPAAPSAATADAVDPLPGGQNVGGAEVGSEDGADAKDSAAETKDGATESSATPQ